MKTFSKNGMIVMFNITLYVVTIKFSNIDDMNIRVRNSRYTIPTRAIKKSFRSKENEVDGK